MDMSELIFPDYSDRKKRPEGDRRFGGVEKQTYPRDKRKGK